MSDSVIAYRYAKALIDLAIQQKVVEDVNKDMSFFKTVCDENRQFLKVMANPIVRHDKKLGILESVFKNNVSDVTYSIFSVLTKKNREKLIYVIAVEFEKLYNKLNKIEKASVSTVSELSKEQREAFLKIVADATGHQVHLEESINPSLIGGYLLKVGDAQVDTSMRKKLNDLKLDLAQ